jgi:hypothetical protein
VIFSLDVFALYSRQRMAYVRGLVRSKTMKQQPHPFTGLFPGDRIIHRFVFSGTALYAYGVIRKIDAEGQWHAEYMSSKTASRPTQLGPAEHEVVGRISARTYLLAKWRGWPNTKEEVDALLVFSSGREDYASWIERTKLYIYSLIYRTL